MDTAQASSSAASGQIITDGSSLAELAASSSSSRGIQTGTYPFDDFEMMILIHKVDFTSTSQTTTFVKVRAGENIVDTDPKIDGLFQQTVNLFVEQGTECVEFEMLDTRERVLAKLKMDVMKDILKDGIEVKSVTEKKFAMKSVQKAIFTPQITLTFCPEAMGDEEKAFVSGLNASAETEWRLNQHIQQVQEQANTKAEISGTPAVVTEPLSEVELLAKACTGPLEMFQESGANASVYVAIVGPPLKKRHAFRIFENEKMFTDGKECKEEIDLLKVMAVSPDPSRPEVFAVHFVDDNKAKRTKKFQRIDRGRDVWIELLQLLVSKVHAERKTKKAKGK